MKHFEEILCTPQEPKKPFSRYDLQKDRLLMNVGRSDSIIEALRLWLNSFDGGISKELFQRQLHRLDTDDSLALKQISDSMGSRSIKKKKSVLPPLPPVGDVVQMLASGNLFIAVGGPEEALRKFIRKSYQTLKGLGRTYVLDLNDMRLEWVDKFQKGKSVEMLQKAKDSEFLIVVGLETPLDIPFYMGDALNTLRRYRVEHEMPIISTFARFRTKDKFFEYFNKFSVKDCKEEL